MRNDDVDDDDHDEDTFMASYTRKDLILYALSIGLGTTSTNCHDDHHYPNQQQPQQQHEGMILPSTLSAQLLVLTSLPTSLLSLLLPYLYKQHPNFQCVPSFYFVLTFYAKQMPKEFHNNNNNNNNHNNKTRNK